MPVDNSKRANCVHFCLNTRRQKYDEYITDKLQIEGKFARFLKKNNKNMETGKVNTYKMRKQKGGMTASQECVSL
jgi:hypothetical protein